MPSAVAHVDRIAYWAGRTPAVHPIRCDHGVHPLFKGITMKHAYRTAIALATMALAAQASAQVTFYEREGFEGRSFTTERRVGNFERFGFNDRASSAVVRGNRWEICDEARIEGTAWCCAPVDTPPWLRWA